jgi:hypothetical protein
MTDDEAEKIVAPNNKQKRRGRWTLIGDCKNGAVQIV